MTNNEEADLARVKDACTALGEHFDTVMIFVTRHESGEQDGTINAAWGAGNWFARYGQVKEWIVKQEELERLDVKRGNEGE